VFFLKTILICNDPGHHRTIIVLCDQVFQTTALEKEQGILSSERLVFPRLINLLYTFTILLREVGRAGKQQGDPGLKLNANASSPALDCGAPGFVSGRTRTVARYTVVDGSAHRTHSTSRVP